MMDLTLNKKILILYFFFYLSVFGTIAQVNGQYNSDDFPPWINDFAPEDEIWGIGVANSMDLAALRARSLIVSQIFWEEGIKDDDYAFNNLYYFFIRCITIDASFEIMNDTRVLRAWEAPDGAIWCRIALRKSDARKYKSVFENIYQEYYNEAAK